MLSSPKFKKLQAHTLKAVTAKSLVASKNTVNAIKVVFYVAKNVLVMDAKIVDLMGKKMKMRTKRLKLVSSIQCQQV